MKTQRESTSRLEKSRAEKSEELLNLQNQADDINSCISQLLQPSSVKDTDGVGSETSSITRLNLIKCLLNDIKELDTAGNDAAEWADSISKIEAQTSSRRKNFENLNLKYAALKDRLKASDENLVVVDDRIMVLKKELR